MPPKKGKKITLNEFLEDKSLGSWADEMDHLPTAPAGPREDDDGGRQNDRYGRRDDFLSSRPDRGPPRDDIPLPTQPPYTAYIGNLPFDITDADMLDFFGPKTKSVKIIKDREERPRGFGYVEFVDLEGLKEGLAKTGASFNGRTIRTSVAEPPKEHGRDAEDSGKFDNPWRRDGPLPDRGDGRDSSRRRYDSTTERAPPPPSMAEDASQWRSARSTRPSEPEVPKRRGPGFGVGSSGAADAEETWSIGNKFKPSAPSEDGGGSRFGSMRGRGDMGPPKDVSVGESDWRRPKPASRGSGSPTSSIPSTPQMGRRKLELLPRSGSDSVSHTPLASPKGDSMLSASSTSSASKPSPFGAARPVDVSSREREVAEKVEREREAAKERGTGHSMSRTNSHTGGERTAFGMTRSSPSATAASQSSTSPRLAAKATPPASNVRPAFSFANAAAKKDAGSSKSEVQEPAATEDKTATRTDEEQLEQVQSVQEKLGEVMI
ncbi:hypothetical protein HGRIS_003668 [Hohenbuehelia grisea]|uniref:RRM domain-containing protein n=1 Tax=Hohenbuehelia grisea TaxID=104357 RepID=A0ABR3JHV1_9AGAR